MGSILENATGLYMTGIRDGKPREAMNTFTGARYTQHSTGVPDGKEGFMAFFKDFLERNPTREIEVVRGLQDGRFAFVHVFQRLNNGENEWVTFDFFDSDDQGRIIEHWDVIARYSPTTPSGHTSIDGVREVVDLERTDDNKRIVTQMIEHALMEGGDVDKVSEFIDDTYIQHNSRATDGLDSFMALLKAEDRPLFYQEIVLMVGQGNFVATLCKASWEGQPLAQSDLFRLHNGKIVEHWDASEQIGPKSEWLNSGKF